MCIAIDVMPDEAKDPALYLPFKGNIDLIKVEHLIKHYGKEKIAAIPALLNCVAWLFIFEVLFSLMKAITLPGI